MPTLAIGAHDLAKAPVLILSSVRDIFLALSHSGDKFGSRKILAPSYKSRRHLRKTAMKSEVGDGRCQSRTDDART